MKCRKKIRIVYRLASFKYAENINREVKGINLSSLYADLINSDNKVLQSIINFQNEKRFVFYSFKE